MPELKSAYGNRPNTMGSPAPGKAAKMTAEDLMNDVDVPAMPQPSGSPAPLTAEALMGDAPPTETPLGVPTEDQFAPEPEFFEANVDQFSNFKDRLVSGLGANDVEKLGYLRQKYGAENAVLKNDKIYFRKSAKDKLKPLDPATLELVNDLVADWSREGVTEAAMLPAEIAGAGVAGPGGAVVGRVASVPMANEFANRIAEESGVPQDPSRNGYGENALGMAAETAFPVVGKQIAKILPGTQAYQAAKKAGEREIVALSKQSKEVALAAHELQQAGLGAKVDGELVGVPGAQVNLMGHHLNPDNPNLNKFANIAAGDPKFINAEMKLAEDWGDSLRNTLTEIGRRNSKGPIAPEKLAESVVNAVNDLQTAEGKAIGAFKTKAMVELKNSRLPLNQQTQMNIKGLLEEFGFKPRMSETQTVLRKGGQDKTKSELRTVWNPPRDLKSLVGTNGLKSVGEVRVVVNNLLELSKNYEKGLNVIELDKARNSIGTASDSLYGTPAGAKLGALSGDLRKTYREVISVGLKDEVERKGFNDVMDDFHMLKDNLKVLKTTLNEDSSAKAIVKNFFTGSENLQKIKAIKKLSPESFASLKEEWLNQTMIQYSSRKEKTGFKATEFLNSIDKQYGKQFVKEVLDDGPGPNTETVRNFLKVAERLNETIKKAGDIDKAGEGKKKAIMDTAIGWIGDIRFKSVNGISALLKGISGEDNAIIQIMTRDGIDKYVAAYPGRIDKKTVAKQLNDILAESKFYRMIGEGVERTSRRVTVDKAQDVSRDR
jgi:hypothetical protein